MCYDTNARPPHPPVSGGAGVGREVELTAADGTNFAAFSATTGRSDAPGIVILPDVRGLHGFYQELALRFAEVGVHATAIDYFGRTAGVGTRGDDFEFMPHVIQCAPDTVALDVAAAVSHLRGKKGGEANAVFTVGFCFGGRASFNQAARDHGLAGVIGFYGRLAEREPGDTNAPILLAGTYRCPVLGLFGGADPMIPADEVELFRKTLEAAGVINEIVVYEQAPHSFFDRAFEQFSQECDDAWMRILDFISTNH